MFSNILRPNLIWRFFFILSLFLANDSEGYKRKSFKQDSRTYEEMFSRYSRLRLNNEKWTPRIDTKAKITPLPPRYCEDLKISKRFPSRTIKIGKVRMGSMHPIVCQTMVNSDTRNINETIDQILKCTEAGAELIRITVQGVKEAEASHKIRDQMIKRNCDTPIVADIHFNPKIASLAVEVFDKIRVNPGNYVDGRKNFKTQIYKNENEFLEGRKRIEEQLLPLIEKCKRFDRALRIGTNHGSLSSRIMNFYGDSPIGMVESAFEFASICRDHDYHNFCFSMKASNPSIMVNSYRLLASEMYKRGFDYPIHLGVTEAGQGEDGRIKSAIGIGSLLQDGIGDTIRVSLTEDPWEELKTCKRLAESALNYFNNENELKKMRNIPEYIETTRNFNNITKRELKKQLPSHVANHYIHKDGSVFLNIPFKALEKPKELFSDLGLVLKNGELSRSLNTPDSIYLSSLGGLANDNIDHSIKQLNKANIGIVAPYKSLLELPIPGSVATLKTNEVEELITKNKSYHSNIKLLPPEGSIEIIPTIIGSETEEEILKIFEVLQEHPSFLILKISSELNRLRASRRIFDILKRNKIEIPVIHHFVPDYKIMSLEDLTLIGAMEIGSLLIDKLGDGLLIDTEFPHTIIKELSFNILQGSRMRTVKTEFISCPSCGRTLFDLQEVTKKIKHKTGHLPGVSIAVMGCIVNGVGEMADADFGYVGGSPGKVDLYVGKQIIERGIPNDQACDRLISLIKKHDRWVDP